VAAVESSYGSELGTLKGLVLKRLWLTLVSIWVWFVFGVGTITAIPVMLVVYLFTIRDPGRYGVGWVLRRVGWLTWRLNPMWSVKVSGHHVENPRHPYVVVSNHQSFADILLLCNLPWEMKWMSKMSILRIPIMGWLMRLAGDIGIERDSRESAVRALEKSRQALKNRTSVMIFPEGTRSTSDDMLPFKDGAFRLAIKTGTPVLPLAIVGTRDALAKHDWRFGPADAAIKVLPPVEVKGLTIKDVDRVKDQERDMIQAAREELRAEGGA
jgi:1-acyl-sn-glycerol-3-phosphate acyltransferase